MKCMQFKILRAGAQYMWGMVLGAQRHCRWILIELRCMHCRHQPRRCIWRAAAAGPQPRPCASTCRRCGYEGTHRDGCRLRHGSGSHGSTCYRVGSPNVCSPRSHSSRSPCIRRCFRRRISLRWEHFQRVSPQHDALPNAIRNRDEFFAGLLFLPNVLCTPH